MGSSSISLIMLALIIVVMYFLLIRPQKKKEKAVNAMRSGLQVGDEIITIGGICGKIVKTKEDSLVIQVGAEKTKFEVMRWSISKVVEGTPKPANKTATTVDEDDAEPAKKAARPKRMKKADAADADKKEDEE